MTACRVARLRQSQLCGHRPLVQQKTPLPVSQGDRDIPEVLQRVLPANRRVVQLPLSMHLPTHPSVKPRAPEQAKPVDGKARGGHLEVARPVFEAQAAARRGKLGPARQAHIFKDHAGRLQYQIRLDLLPRLPEHGGIGEPHMPPAFHPCRNTGDLRVQCHPARYGDFALHKDREEIPRHSGDLSRRLDAKIMVEI